MQNYPIAKNTDDQIEIVDSIVIMEVYAVNSTKNNKCCICETEKEETRPYGPGGKAICYQCAQDPKYQEQAKEYFLNSLQNACDQSEDGNAILTEHGPIPLIPKIKS